MAVLADFSDQDARAAALGILERIDQRLHLFDPVGHRGCLALVDAGDGFDLGAVPAEHLFHRVRNLADGSFRTRSADCECQKIAVAFAGAAGQCRQRLVDVLLVALLLQPRQLVDLQPPHGGIFHLQHVDSGFIDWLVFVDADHRLPAGVDPGLRFGGSFLDPQLWYAGLDRLRHAAERLDFLDVAPGFCREIAGQPLDIIGAAPGIDDAVGAAFLLQEQLRIARDAGREIGRQRQRLIECVGMQRLHHVVVDVLRGQRPAGGLAVGAQAERARVLRIELRQELGPQQPRRAHFCDFHEKIHADRPEERQPRRKTVDVEACSKPGAEIFDTVGEGIGEFEVLRRAGFLHVIAGNRNRIVFRHFLRGIRKNVGNDPHRWRRRIDVGVAHHELFQDVVLDRS